MPNDNQIVQMTVGGSNQSTGDTFFNVFHYRANTTANIPFADMSAALTAYWDSPTSGILYAALLCMSDQYRFDFVRYDNLDNPDDFVTIPTPNLPVGVVSGDVLPPFVSWGFELQRRTRATRNGRKAFAGVPEALQNNGVATLAAAPLLAGLASAIEAGNNVTIVGVGSCTFEPVIIRKTGAFSYSAVNDVLNVAYKRISTQNSRKR